MALPGTGLARTGHAFSAVQLAEHDTADCAQVDSDELRRLLGIELEVPVLSQASPDAVRVQLRCQASELRIVLSGRVARSKVLQLSQAEVALQPRIIALTVAELLHDARLPPARAAAARPPRRKPPPEASSRLRVDLEALAQAHVFAVDSHPMLGAGVALFFGHRSHLGARIAVTAAGDRQPRRLRPIDGRDVEGSVSRTLLTFSAALDWPLAAASAAELHVGAGYRLGAGSSRGEGPDPSSWRALWGGPFVTARAQTRLLDPLVLTLAAVAGATNFAVRGVVEDADDARLEGAWFALQLGAGIRLR